MIFLLESSFISFVHFSDQPGYAAVIDAHGNVLDTVKLPTLLFTRGMPGTRVNPKDMDRVGDLIAEQRPHIIAIASESKSATFVKEAVHRKSGIHASV